MRCSRSPGSLPCGRRADALWRDAANSGTVQPCPATRATRDGCHVDRTHWSGNSYRNFHYLIASAETGEALAIDPLEWRLCLDKARARGWQITQILNTHEHRDHTGGNAGLLKATGAKLLAHAAAAQRIGGVDRGLAKGDVIRIGRDVELECLDTPGHTLAHVCLFAHAAQPALFCGDTLFNAGAGNCHNGGDPARVSLPCSRCGNASRSWTLAADTSTVWISFVPLSTPTWAFSPKNHC